jgi:hypothetical protein
MHPLPPLRTDKPVRYRVQFDEAYEDFPDLETNLVRDKLARLTSSIVSIIEELQPHSPDFTLKDACDQLVRSCPYSTLVLPSCIVPC